MPNITSSQTASPSFLNTPEDVPRITGQNVGNESVVKPRLEMGTQNLEFAEEQLVSYLRDRNSVSPDWRDYFDELEPLPARRCSI